MAEFEPSTPAIRLFDEVDLAPAPQTTTLQRALNIWREARGDLIEPDAAELQSSIASDLTPSVFIFSPSKDAGEFNLAWAGKKAIDFFGCEGPNVQLSHFRNKRIAVYARHLFELVNRRQEPACARFTVRRPGSKPATLEMLAAPLSKAGQADWIFGAMMEL